MPNQWRRFWELLLGMTEKELRARYKYTVLGFLWLVLNPVLQMLIIGFIFTFFIKKPIEHYYYFLFTGLLIWNFFSLSLAKTTPSIVHERTLIKKAKFPRAVIPLSIILANFFHTLLAFIIFLIPVAFLGTFSFNKLPLLFISLLLLLAFTVGFGLLTAALNVRFRDVNFFTQALLIVWFYASPIIYPLSMIPAKIHWLWFINPLSSMLELSRVSLLGGEFHEKTTLWANMVFIVLTVLIGVVVFQKESANFDDWV
ncbi:MAG: ABC transporter permease [Patescibacteria group bacterium]